MLVARITKISTTIAVAVALALGGCMHEKIVNEERCLASSMPLFSRTVGEKLLYENAQPVVSQCLTSQIPV